MSKNKIVTHRQRDDATCFRRGGALRWAPFVAAALFGLVLAGCGSNGSDSANPQGADAGTEEATDSDTGMETVGEEEPSGETYSWTFSGASQEDQALGELAKIWVNEVESQSGGRFSFDVSWLGQTIGQGEELQATGDGRIEVSTYINIFTPAELPLTQVTSLPFLTYDGVAMAKALKQLHEEDEGFQAEHERNNVHPLAFLPMDVMTLTTTEPVDSVADLEGKPMRAIGYFGQAFQMAGAEIVSLLPGEIYEALQRGTVIGTTNPLDGVASLGYYEVAPYIQDTGMGQYVTLTLAVNKDVWEALTSDDQQLLQDAADAMVDRIAEVNAAKDEASCDTVLEAGATVSQWDDSETAKLRELAAEPIHQSWIETVEAAGIDTAVSFIARYAELHEEYSAESEWVSGIEACLRRSNA